MTTISIINTKGGVGKTVTCVHLGAALAQLGQRVLLLDADLQHNLTSYFSVDASSSPTLADVLLNDVPIAIAAQSVRRNLDIVPSTSATAEADAQLAAVPGGEVRLRRAFHRLRQEKAFSWDIALIDCPAGWSSVSRNAVLSSQRLLVPVNCEPAAYHCAVATIAGAQELAEYHMHQMLDPWVLLTRLRGTRAARSVAALAASTWGQRMLQARVRHAERINELAISGRAGADVSKGFGGPVVQDYEALAQEVMRRVKEQDT